MQKEFRKQDQIAILAQNFLLCGKLRLEFFREPLFRTRSCGAVKCRDGNCRRDGAECGVATMRIRKVINHEGRRITKEAAERMKSFV
jgi:hypothetical protein